MERHKLTAAGASVALMVLTLGAGVWWMLPRDREWRDQQRQAAPAHHDPAPERPPTGPRPPSTLSVVADAGPVVVGVAEVGAELVKFAEDLLEQKAGTEEADLVLRVNGKSCRIPGELVKEARAAQGKLRQKASAEHRRKPTAPPQASQN